MIAIDYKSRVPIYDQIAGGIIRLKTVGALNDGDKLPSVRALALKLNINPNTVQKAYSILENDGVIFSVSGKGSFISGDEVATNAIVDTLKSDFKMAVETAKRMGLTLEQLKEITDSVYEGGNGDD